MSEKLSYLDITPTRQNHASCPIPRGIKVSALVGRLLFYGSVRGAHHCCCETGDRLCRLPWAPECGYPSSLAHTSSPVLPAACPCGARAWGRWRRPLSLASRKFYHPMLTPSAPEYVYVPGSPRGLARHPIGN